jgi:hypothetical protein
MMTDVTRILNAIEQGDTQATDKLLPMVYEELRRLATQKVLNEQPGQTLQPTALVHEAYLRLSAHRGCTWDLFRVEITQNGIRSESTPTISTRISCMICDSIHTSRRTWPMRWDTSKSSRVYNRN